MAQLLSVNVGLPRDIEWKGKTVRTAVWKDAVRGRRQVGKLNIDGDGQGDLQGHGGEHRAVLVYQIDSYRYWERQLGRQDFVFGQFGENFTVEGLPDDEVCIGDRYRIGGALFEVTQPRVTCYRVGIRMDEPRMAALLVEHHRPGFYFRVLETGEVAAGDEIVKVSDGPERMSVAEADALLYLTGHSRAQLERALRIPALPAGWRSSFQALLQQGLGQAKGNPGLSVVSPPPAWTGFRPMRVSRIDRESDSVFSLVLVPADGEPPGGCATWAIRGSAPPCAVRRAAGIAKLLAVRPAEHRALSREHQARRKRPRQYLSAHSHKGRGATWRSARPAAASRSVRAANRSCY
jgi:MOSC domain-containing protein YiiM